MLFCLRHCQTSCVAMPCTELNLISGEDLGPYRAASKAIMAVLQRYGPAERLGLDEVFVDATQVRPTAGTW